MKDGKIAAIGKIVGPATREFDAADQVVAPGFIDVHTHAEDIDDQPLAENFLRMGVTTLVLGNCGSSTVHVRAFLDRLESIGIATNVATLIGHGTVRSRAIRSLGPGLHPTASQAATTEAARAADRPETVA